MREFEPLMIGRINAFLRQPLKFEAGPVNMTPKYRYLGLETAGFLVFGYDLNLQEDNSHRYLTRAIPLGNHRVDACLQATIARGRSALGAIADPSTIRDNKKMMTNVVA
ncbi:hypothetical protein F5Y08DRAFT_115405 [Xylaria arbuscula]|nr:hypothetical protein F5Y08DRAFT_115405 [Xylaria arbuscula]